MSSHTEQSERLAQGQQTRKDVLGKEFVNRVTISQGALNAPFLEMATEASWGHVWSRPHWSLRERSMVTIAILAALGHHDELALHIKSTKNTGCSREDIQEALLHAAIYGGIPVGNGAFKVANSALEEIEDA